MRNDEFRKSLVERSIRLARDGMRLADLFPNKRSAWVIADQLIRARTSIGANIVEAQAASSQRDFINFLNYSLKSGNEAKYWLILAKDMLSENNVELEKVLTEVDEITKILGSSIVTLKKKKNT